MMNMKMILASASPRRREILENLGIQFTVQSSDFDEREHIASEEKRLKRKLSPAEQAMSLALQKAQTVAERMDRYDAEEFIVIGVDTCVVIDEIVLGKPADEQEAFEMLKMLSNREHFVISGVAVVHNNGKVEMGTEITVVKMAELLDEDIRKYIKNEYVLDKAGAYAIQGRAAAFIERIEGCYFNVVGLPVYRLAQMLRKHGLDLFDLDHRKM